MTIVIYVELQYLCSLCQVSNCINCKTKFTFSSKL